MADWAARMLNFRRGELRLAVLAALFYFAVLCGYFFLRPVREAMGVSRGMDQLRWLFESDPMRHPKPGVQTELVGYRRARPSAVRTDRARGGYPTASD